LPFLAKTHESSLFSFQRPTGRRPPGALSAAAQ
jgi:hypothetical protein